MNNPFKKYVKITTTLPKGCDDVIGTSVHKGIETVGKVIAYDKETGNATIRIKFTIWKEIAGNNIGLLKNKNL
jgi:hypothetical protein